jgi:hypothetical protein
MAARDSALNIPEVVEHIIWFLPGGAIHRAKTTCKMWYRLITTSPKIRKVTVLRPVVPSAFGLYAQGRTPSGGPRYKVHMKLHFLLDGYRNCGAGQAGLKVIELPLNPNRRTPPHNDSVTWPQLLSGDSLWTALHRVAQDFAASPPCSALGMNVTTSLETTVPGLTSCVIYVPDGVRMEHIIETGQKLITQVATGRQWTWIEDFEQIE